MRPLVKDFLFPKISRRFLVRLILVAAGAWVIFGYVLTPVLIKGRSMAPTYHDGQFNFCFKLRYLFSSPKRFDIVFVQLSGQSVMLLKRVIALEGDTLAFQDGQLLVNDIKLREPYVRFASDWNLAPRKVDRNTVYVVGDNRAVPMHIHQFGETPIRRIAGAPLW